MKKFITLIILFVKGFALSDCQPNVRQNDGEQTRNTTRIVKYANFFDVEEKENYTLLTVRSAEGIIFRYGLYPKNLPPPALPEDCQAVPVPIEKAALYATTYANLFETLGCRQLIRGFAGTSYLFSDSLRKAAAAGEIAEVGTDKQPDVELLRRLSPDIVMMYIGGGDEAKLSLLQRVGLTVVVNADFTENHPLGRAEWIKVVGLLCNKMREADSIFNQVEKNYRILAEKVANAVHKPSVFTNIPYGNTWYMPGGDSFMANLLKDAGADYLWQDEHRTGSLPLGIEAVFAKIQHADFWINPGSMESLEMIRKTDTRFGLLKAVQTGKVFNNNKRQLKDGGNDYWESGSTRPDRVLADLIAIFHPEILPNHELFYFRQLR